LGLDLRDRVYIVTGRSSGLGHATARQLIDEGARVVISGAGQAQFVLSPAASYLTGAMPAIDGGALRTI
jgi:NADP-dependent 3-hydroxy acid dehydrogenase YdfG